MEDGGAECDLNCRCLDQEVSEEKNVSLWPRDQACDILMKHVAAFCTRPKSLSEANVKSFRFIPLAEEISKQTSFDCLMWLSVLTLMKIYNEKKQTEQDKLQNVQIEKRSTRKWNGAKSCVQEDTQI